MDPRRGAEWSAGFRAVVVNLCLAGPEARALGVENHVCEVQLILVAMLIHNTAPQPPHTSSDSAPPPPAPAAGVPVVEASSSEPAVAAIAATTAVVGGTVLSSAEAAEESSDKAENFMQRQRSGDLDINRHGHGGGGSAQGGDSHRASTFRAFDGDNHDSDWCDDDDDNVCNVFETCEAGWHQDFIRFRDIREHCTSRPADILPFSEFAASQAATTAASVTIGVTLTAAAAAAAAEPAADLPPAGWRIGGGQDPRAVLLPRQLLPPPAGEVAVSDSVTTDLHSGSAKPAIGPRAALLLPPPAAAADVVLFALSPDAEAALRLRRSATAAASAGGGCALDNNAAGDLEGELRSSALARAAHTRTAVFDLPRAGPANSGAGAATDSCLRSEPSERDDREGNSRRGSRVGSDAGLGEASGSWDAGARRLEEVLRKAFLASALLPRDARGREAAALLREAFEHSHACSAMFTSYQSSPVSNPMAAASSKRTFQAVMACFCGYFAYRTYTSAVQLPHAGRIPVSRLCMTFAAARDPALPPAAARVAAFGPLVDGCAWPQTPWSASPLAFLPTTPSTMSPYGDVSGKEAETGERCADIGREVLVHGVWFDTYAGPAARDPMRWTVRAWRGVAVTDDKPSASKNLSLSGSNISNSSNASAARVDDGEWSVVGASEWRILGDGSLEFFPNLAFPTPVAPRGARVHVDLRPPWPWVVDWPAFEALTALGFAAALVSAVLGRRAAVSSWLAGCFAAGSLVFVVAGSGYNAAGRNRAAATCWLDAVANIVYGAGFSRFQSHLVRTLATCGIVTLASLLVNGVAVYGQPWGETAADLVLSADIGAIAFAAVIAVLRRYVLLRSARTVRGDRVRYDEAWAGVLAADGGDDGGGDGLVALKHEARSLQEAARGEHARQLRRRYLPPRAADHPPPVTLPASCHATSVISTSTEDILEVGSSFALHRPGPGSGAAEPPRLMMTGSVLVTRRQSCGAMAVVSRLRAWLRLFSCRSCRVGFCRGRGGGGSVGLLTSQLDLRRHLVDNLDPLAPVESLQQLFHQASAVHPLLLGKVCGWAAEAAAAGVGEVRVQGGKGAKVKSLSRAVEKTYRAYREDVSRLLDLCRQSLVVSTPAAAARCLAALRADAEAQPVRVKNRMDPAYDAALSAGYRDVVVNLRLVGPEARRLGLETHVCEVQVLLEAFARLKNDEGHKRYVAFRNLRGE